MRNKAKTLDGAILLTILSRHISDKCRIDMDFNGARFQLRRSPGDDLGDGRRILRECKRMEGIHTCLVVNHVVDHLVYSMRVMA